MPVCLQSVPKSERSNFHQPNAGAAYAERFKDIAIPAVAAAAAQMKRSPLSQARAEALPRRDLPGILRDDAHRD